MEQSRVYTAADAARKIGVAESTIEGWVRERLVSPSVLADGDQTLFDEADLAVLEQLRHLREIGYAPADIRKIAKKVGLPKPRRGKARRARQLLTVGELAKRAGLNTRTIKYWEERGIIEPTSRSEGGYRLYEEHYVLFCNLIQDLQNFGYTLEQIKEAADLFRTFHAIQTGGFAETGKRKAEVLSLMEDRIGALLDRMDQLTRGISRWRKLLREKRAEIGALQKRLAKAAPPPAATKEARTEGRS